MRSKIKRHRCDDARDISFNKTAKFCCEIEEVFTHNGECGWAKKLETSYKYDFDKWHFPWRASLGFVNPNSIKEIDWNHYCTGALISNRHILTATQCVNRRPRIESTEFNFQVMFGVHNLTLGEARTESSGIIFDISPNSTQFKEDLAILQLKNKVKFSEDISPICLPTSINYDVDSLAGLGVTDVGLITGMSMRSVYSHKYCNGTFGRRGENITLAPRNLFCAGNEIMGGFAWNRDMGSPLVHFNTTGSARLRAVIVGVDVGESSMSTDSKTTPEVYARMDSPDVLNFVRASIGMEELHTPPTLSENANAKAELFSNMTREIHINTDEDTPKLAELNGEATVQPSRNLTGALEFPQDP